MLAHIRSHPELHAACRRQVGYQEDILNKHLEKSEAASQEGIWRTGSAEPAVVQELQQSSVFGTEEAGTREVPVDAEVGGMVNFHYLRC